MSDLYLSEIMAGVARTVAGSAGVDVASTLRTIAGAALGNLDEFTSASVVLESKKWHSITEVNGTLAQCLLHPDLRPVVTMRPGRTGSLWMFVPRKPGRAMPMAAAALGITTMACLDLPLNTAGTTATINLYSTSVEPMRGESRRAAELFAVHAALGLSSICEIDQLRAAVANRDVIGQAKGILMERCSIDEDSAFRMLTKLSQDMNVKVAEIARRVVQAGPTARSTS